MAAEEGTTNSRPPRLTEFEKTERWRMQCFIELGFMADDAITLANSRVDHWVVERAIKKGCSHEHALAIFSD